MTNTNDIVIRLRALANALKMGEWIALTETCASAADEIVHLQHQIVLLRAERDEARRRVCEICVSRGGVYRRVGNRTVECSTVEDVADVCGWDCFKEKP